MGTQLTVHDNADLANVERNMQLLVPRFDALLDGQSLSSARLIQSLLMSCERNPKLLQCPMSNLISGAMTFAALRLPLDGASGQGFLLPFRNKGSMIAQPCIGYKGFVTIGGRSGMSIVAGTVREGDAFDYSEGSGGFVHHKRVLDNKKPIIAFWSVAASKTRPDVVKILGIGEVNDIMARSPAVKFGADTPWKDPIIGFPAMGEKSAMRRLSRSIPYDVDDGRLLLAARMDEAFDEQGKMSYIGADRGLRVEGDNGFDTGEPTQAPQPSATDLMTPRLSEHEKTLRAQGDAAAAKGMDALFSWWSGLTGADQRLVERYKEDTLKPKAFDADP